MKLANRKSKARRVVIERARAPAPANKPDTVTKDIPLKKREVVLVRGHYVSYLPLCSRNEPVFLAVCTPLAMPETRECVVHGATNVFTTVHAVDMKILHIDAKAVRQWLQMYDNISIEPLHIHELRRYNKRDIKTMRTRSTSCEDDTSEWHLGWERSSLHGVSWYHLLHPDCCKEAQNKHRLRADEQMDHLMVSDYRRPWTPTTPEGLQARCRPLREGLRGRGKGIRRGWASGTLTHTTKHNASVVLRRFSENCETTPEPPRNVARLKHQHL
ncbi:unnamed protein product [Diatraea saccharalis]|uniref:Uncharacterized protein n=1 Tax=Diatraea saccharalis TaxID=40085 RepID=A0A9N9WHQ6_9NEOP|nr:unnamed protein product [Diatraea saccharalis]